MPRIRTVKLELWTHEELSVLPAETHILAAALLNYADDDGYFNANPRLIQATIFPLRELSSNVPVMLQELSDIGYVRLFTGTDGKHYGHICNFKKHQVISHKKDSPVKLLEPSSNGPVNIQTPSVLNGKERNREERGNGMVLERSQLEDWTDDDVGIAVCKALKFSGLKHPQWVSMACRYIRERMGFKTNQQVLDWLPAAWQRYQARTDIEFKYGFEKWLAEGKYVEDKPTAPTGSGMQHPTETLIEQLEAAGKHEDAQVLKDRLAKARERAMAAK